MLLVAGGGGALGAFSSYGGGYAGSEGPAELEDASLCFSLVTPGRTLDLQADSATQRDHLVRGPVVCERGHPPPTITGNFEMAS